MIPQQFVKGAGERVFFGPYEYPTGASIIWDFGNPLCTFASGSNIIYNVGSANVTGSLVPYNNPSPVYPLISPTNGGVMITNQVAAVGSNYLEWNYSSSFEETAVTIFALNGGQLNPWTSYVPYKAGASSIEYKVYGNTVVTGSASLDVNLYNSNNILSTPFSTTLNVDINNNRNGYNMIATSADNNASHKLYINQTLVGTDTSGIGRANNANSGAQLGLSSKMKIMAYLQYPKILTPKEIRQIYKVFSVRFFT
jgi:hypothetical protein